MILTKFNPKNRSIDPWNNVFDTLLNDSFLETRTSAKLPAVNISETKTGYEIELAAPGLKKEDFKINLEKNILSISAEQKTENAEEGKAEEGKQYNKREFGFQSFSRNFNIPDNVNTEDIQANYENGVLSVKLTKKEEEIRLKTIEVK